MRSQFVRVTDGVDFSVVRNDISALEDLQRFFTMSKADNLS